MAGKELKKGSNLEMHLKIDKTVTCIGAEQESGCVQNTDILNDFVRHEISWNSSKDLLVCGKCKRSNLESKVAGKLRAK